jgi:hypothetical protein
MGGRVVPREINWRGVLGFESGEFLMSCLGVVVVGSVVAEGTAEGAMVVLV